MKSFVKMGDDKDPATTAPCPSTGPWIPGSQHGVGSHGEYIRKDLLLDRLRQAIMDASIATEGKRFVPYSGRYTLNTTLKPFLPAAVLMTLMGHVDDAMA